MSTLAFPFSSGETSAEARPLWLAGVIGFFFVFRVSLSFLFFQASPVTGTTVTIGLGLALLFDSFIHSAGYRAPALRPPSADNRYPLALRVPHAFLGQPLVDGSIVAGRRGRILGWHGHGRRDCPAAPAGR